MSLALYTKRRCTISVVPHRRLDQIIMTLSLTLSMNAAFTATFTAAFTAAFTAGVTGGPNRNATPLFIAASQGHLQIVQVGGYGAA